MLVLHLQQEILPRASLLPVLDLARTLRALDLDEELPFL